MAQTLTQRMMELGVPFVMANELVKQMNAGVYNVTRLINAGWVEDLARYLSVSLPAGTFKATKAVEYSMIPAIAILVAGGGGPSGFPITASLGPLYFMQRVVPTFVGALYRAVRSSDNATRLIYAGADGQPDLSGDYGTWAGSSIINPDEIYDQRGLYGPLTQATAATRMTYNADMNVRGKAVISGYILQNRGYLLPTALTFQRNDLGVIGVSAPLSMGANVCLAQFDTVLGNRLAIQASFGDTRLGAHIIDNGTNFSATSSECKSRSQPQVYAFAGRPGGSVLHIDDQVSAIAAVANRTLTGGNTGISSNSGGMEGAWMGQAFYLSAPTDGEIAAAKAYLYGAFDILTASNAAYVFDGDSITHGRGTTGGLNKNLQYFFEQNIGRRLFVENVGLNGQTALFLHANRVAREAAMRRAATRLYRVMIGTNDLDTRASGTIVGFGTTLWNSYTLPLIQYMKAQGWTVWFGTMLPRVWTGSAQDIADKTAERTVYNNLAISAAGTEGFGIIDYGSIASMQTPSNTSRYADGIHPNTLGYADMSALEVSVIQPTLPAG